MVLRSRMLILSTLVLAVAAGMTGCSRQTAEEKGAELAQEKVDLAKGIGGVLEKSGSKAGESLAHGASETLLGFGKGIEKSFGRSIASGASLEQAGIKVSRVQDARATGDKTVHGIDVYVVADKDVAGKLRLVGFDKGQNEVVRTSIPLKYAAGDGRYETIALDERVQLLSISTVSFEFAPDAAAN